MERVWADPDGVAIVFTGTSAEFALHPMSEWLFFTGNLPSDPIGRFTSTISYIRGLLFAPTTEVWEGQCGRIQAIHRGVESDRGQTISNRDYRDTLMMLLHYSLRADEFISPQPAASRRQDAQEALENCLALARQMGIEGFPGDLAEYDLVRQDLANRLGPTEWTLPLLESYRRALGPIGYFLLRRVYGGLLEPDLAGKLGMRRKFLSMIFERYCSLLVKTGLQRILLTPRIRGIRNLVREAVSA